MPGVTTKSSPWVASLISLASLGRRNNPVAACLARFHRAMQSKLLQRTLVSKITNILDVQAGEHGDRQQFELAAASGFGRRRDDFAIAVNRQKTHARIDHNFHRTLDGLANVKNLEVEKYLFLARLKFTHKIQPGAGEQLQADFKDLYPIAELVDNTPGIA